jgi:type VII secretion-associated serine protease mycosin
VGGGGGGGRGGGGTVAEGGQTLLADDSQCTTQKDNPDRAADQHAVPWEVTYANTLDNPSGLTGKGVTVAIIDTGIADLHGQLSQTVVGGGDFTGGGGYTADVDGHGTLVASIIAARRQPSSTGMVGIAPDAKLLIYREAGCNVPRGNSEDAMAAAINAAVADGAQIINISQDGFTADNNLKAAVLNAYQKNVLIVASAGNNGDSRASDGKVDYGINPVMYPAVYAPYLLSVGAAEQNGDVAEFSETGSYVGVTAPGVDVGGLLPDGKVWLINGTSFAAPYVTGLAALLLQNHRNWTPDTLMKVLEATASGNGKWTRSAGWGEVNANAALQADPDHLSGLFGAGPNADGPAVAKPVTQGSTMAPIVDAAPARIVVDQRRGAYVALGVAALTVIVAATGVLVARDARRRRKLT